MKFNSWRLTYLLIGMLVGPSILAAQQISFQLPVYPDELSTAFSAMAQGKELYFQGPVSNGDATEVALVKTDGNGNVLWTRMYGPTGTWKPYTTLHPNGPEILSLLRWNKGSETALRILSHTSEGTLTGDHILPLTPETYYPDGAGMQNGQLCVYGTGFIGNKAHAWMAHLKDWSTPFTPVLFKTGVNETLKRVKVLPSKYGGYIIALFIRSNVNAWIHLHRTDSVFNSVWDKKYFAAELDPGFIGLAETRDTGLVFSMFQSSGNSQQPFASAITRIQKNGNIVWKHVFADTDKKVVTALSTNANDQVTGVGFSDYITVLTNDFEKKGNAWHFGIDVQGKLLWSRQVIQSGRDYDGTFYGILPADNGFYCFGDQAGKFVNHPLLSLDQDMWAVNFDERGCWNGNCDPVIYLPGTTAIESQSLSGTFSIYPNPVSESFRLHGEVQGVTAIALLDIHGRMVSSWSPGKMDSVYSLPAALPSGTYWLRIWNQQHTQVIPLSVIRQP